MAVFDRTRIPEEADIVLVGTGFASSFFLSKLLETGPRDLRILVLERGPFADHQERMDGGPGQAWMPDRFFDTSGKQGKDWAFSLGLGGSSNCWVGNTPRMIPADFETFTRFGKGYDWPFSYDDLEPFYLEAETLMQVAGKRMDVYPASAPFPLPPHSPSLPEVALAKAWPSQFGPMPTARASRQTATRPACCANGVCKLCPIQAKFTIMGDMMALYEDPRVTLRTGCDVRSLWIEGGNARGVEWRLETGEEGRSKAAQIVLGANGLFNPTLLLRSGDPSPLTGKRLHEQQGVTGRVFLDGMDHFQGSTYVTGLAYNLWTDEERRRHTAPGLVETKSVGPMRAEAGKWRQVIPIRMVFEDLPQDHNQVRLPEKRNGKPIAHFEGISAYTQAALDRALSDAETLFAALPVDWIELDDPATTESHIQGTTVMGKDPSSSVVDEDGLHHHWRNVRVLGSSVFPTGSPANPTLTLAAHALRAASRMEGA